MKAITAVANPARMRLRVQEPSPDGRPSDQ
jgi:hypothetical protein